MPIGPAFKGSSPCMAAGHGSSLTHPAAASFAERQKWKSPQSRAVVLSKDPELISVPEVNPNGGSRVHFAMFSKRGEESQVSVWQKAPIPRPPVKCTEDFSAKLKGG